MHNDIDVLNQEIADEIAGNAIKISNALAGIKDFSWQEFQASIIFSRICLNYLSVMRYSITSRYYQTIAGLEIRDISTQAVLARGLIEGYLTLFYFTLTKDEKVEIEFKKLLWKYHKESERFKILKLIYPDSKNLPQILKYREQTRKRLMESRFFQSLNNGLQKKLLAKDKSKHLSNVEICKLANIHCDYYRSTYKQLSNFVHYSPYLNDQFDVTNNEIDETELFSNISNMSCGYMTAVLSGFRDLFSEYNYSFPDKIERTIQIWQGVHKLN